MIEEGKYEVLCPDGQLLPASYYGLRRAEDITIAVLRKYVAAFYDRNRRAWEKESLRLLTLTEQDPNLDFERYTLRVKTSDKTFLEKVHELLNSVDEVYKKDTLDFPNIHFDRHLYQPLLISDKHERLESTPGALNEGEAQFVRGLREYLHTHKSEFEGKEVFLLRNLTRGRGIGFFEAGGGEAFYPDFILWVIKDKQQSIVFIDPHGLRYAQGGFNDPKIQLYKDLKALESALQPHCRDWQVFLTSFVVCTSDIDQATKWFGKKIDEFEENHVLFNDDPDYIGKLLGSVIGLH